MDEFKKFIARGNVLDLAVGVVIGAAFGKITTSLTESILMPLIGWIFGDVDFSNWFIRLSEIPAGYTGAADNYAQLKEAGVAMIGYGDFLTQITNFLILAFALFLIVRMANRIMDSAEEKKKEAENTSDVQEVATDPQLDVLNEILAQLKQDGRAAPPDTSH
nr:large conductance mechanosensitive channel protein MscL [Pseudopontixanthobacter vadosimaris]